MESSHLSKIILGFILISSAISGNAAAIHDTALFTTNILQAGDDYSSDQVNLGFSAAIGGTSYDYLYVNNNGNVTFTGPLSNFTPEDLIDGSHLIIAPFWSDVDTSGDISGVTTYGSGILNGRSVFGVNWIDVGYFPGHTNKLNSFQMILTDRSDITAGDFDIQFNYDTVKWESSSATGGVQGLGGTTAAVGYSVNPTTTFQLAGSFENGALIDGGKNALAEHSLNSDVPGQYNFSVRSGQITGAVPEPETYALMVSGLALMGFISRRRHKVLRATTAVA